jgi:hypothetical protein
MPDLHLSECTGYERIRILPRTKRKRTMQSDKMPRWASLMGLLLGLALLFIGGRFLLAPEVAERGFGLIYHQPNTAFHTIKGIRDVFSGLLFAGFALAGWRKPLAAVVLAGSLIPVVDMTVVLATDWAVPGAEWIHGTTALVLWMFGYLLLKPTAGRSQ